MFPHRPVGRGSGSVRESILATVEGPLPAQALRAVHLYIPRQPVGKVEEAEGADPESPAHHTERG